MVHMAHTVHAVHAVHAVKTMYCSMKVFKLHIPIYLLCPCTYLLTHMYALPNCHIVHLPGLPAHIVYLICLSVYLVACFNLWECPIYTTGTPIHQYTDTMMPKGETVLSRMWIGSTCHLLHTQLCPVSDSESTCCGKLLRR